MFVVIKVLFVHSFSLMCYLLIFLFIDVLFIDVLLIKFNSLINLCHL